MTFTHTDSKAEGDLKQPNKLTVIADPQVRETGIRTRLTRREMVQKMLQGAAILPLLAGAHPVRCLADPITLAEADAKAGAAEWSPEFLNLNQNETVTVLAEQIVPGSTKARVNRVVDLLLKVSDPANQQKFISSLDAVDRESKTRFGQMFIGLTSHQQEELLTISSTRQNRSDPATDDPDARGPEAPLRTLQDHFEYLKGWFVSIYYASEVGMRELGWTEDFYFASFPGCDHPAGHP